MRTVSVSHEMNIGAGSVVTMSTEVIVDDDDDAEERGREASEFLARFSSGFSEAE